MKRTKEKKTVKLNWELPPVKEKADAILTGDWHLREDTPTCRTDDFINRMWNKVDFIKRLSEAHECQIINSGDLFDFWKPSPYLLSQALHHLPDNMFTVYGNHDLPQHSMEMSFKSGLFTLWKAGKIQIADGTHWNQEPHISSFNCKSGAERQLLVWHTMTYQGKKPWPGCESPKGSTLLRKFTEPDLILTGHNHKPFVEELDGRLLVNPGSILRMTADQADHRPRVYLWYADTNEVEAVYLPVEDGVISREHIENKQERDERIDSFISMLDGDWEAEMSFEDNIEKFQQKNKIHPKVMDIVYKAID